MLVLIALLAPGVIPLSGQILSEAEDTSLITPATGSD
ncbi:uncharacterized protein METZ01_LOCUS395515, partial [marine metagenome]